MYCTNCGVQQSSDANFCQSCGHHLKAAEAPAPAPPPVPVPVAIAPAKLSATPSKTSPGQPSLSTNSQRQLGIKMNENPYAPPKALVDDAQTVAISQGRPTQVTLAIKLWAASYCFGILMLVLYWDYFTNLQTAGSLLFNQAFSLVLVAWLYYKVYLGRNWARITLLVMIILGFAMTASGTFRSMVSAMPMPVKAQMLLSVGVNFVVLWLLFFSAGQSWFSAPKQTSTA